MADTRTLQDMLDRIADEIKTDDLQGTAPGAANIYNAVFDAIKNYQRESLFVQDKIDASIMSQLNIDTYAVPDDLVSITQLNIIVNGQRYPMKPRTVQELMKYITQVTTVTAGQPYWYTFYNTDAGNGEIRVFPAADAATYAFEFMYQGRIPFPATLATTNFWTTIAEPIIRNHAKWLLYRGVLRDPDAAAESAELMNEEFTNFLQESEQKQFTGTLTATRF